MKKGRSTHCLFCDDIRQEVGGKFSLVGVYTDAMLISAPHYPVTLPKLAIYVLLSTPIKAPFDTISGILIGTSGEELTAIEALDITSPSDAPKDITKATIGLMAIVSPLQILKDGVLEVWMEIDGERERAGRLRVALQPDTAIVPASVSRPPPAES